MVRSYGQYPEAKKQRWLQLSVCFLLFIRFVGTPWFFQKHLTKRAVNGVHLVVGPSYRRVFALQMPALASFLEFFFFFISFFSSCQLGFFLTPC
ncbi:uncharacterized protein P174DRAFT_160328 [Aspergillus novofumigatus IBT 16806]|uniref:Uncharacterized protein n=1 Tax=Aspergillus novofumigatus (strain IBT 16806) TaxID=1392255 RepID=A0A2I1C810_ASPN1|nr:uncharacterized protein P174DRAFT_160328 [Aspergillus novofumigatus IBT 16806]PKX93750.1 hypothetical protein P174DRAFT_160328 [Aspergillus novofumigatus IBT 16806]